MRWLLLSWSRGSRAQGLSSCGAQAWLPCDLWNPPGPGIESVSPALAGGLLAPGPLGKSLSFLITHSTEGSTAVLSLQFLLSLKSQGDGAAYSMSALYTQWVCCTAAETHAKEPWSSKGDFRQTCPSFAMEGDMVFTVLVGNLPCASEGDTISIF